MEDEDFGFTRRAENVLKKVLNVGNEQTEGKDTAGYEKRRSPTATKAVEGVVGYKSLTTAPGSGTAGHRSEALQRSPTVSSSSASTSVAPSTPNIPNVVEYHLKVKPSSTTNARRLDANTDRQRRADDMKKEKSPLPSAERKKDLVSKLSRLSIDNNVFEGSTELPQVFQVKYLGSHDARGLWGIKHTRRPVDNMVSAAKSLPASAMLPLIKLAVSEEGVALLPLDKRREPSTARMYHIETISYGVQDLVYTRVFSMIVVRDTENFRRVSPFECHGFVCESKHHARQLTYALATAFEIYSRTVKARDKMAEMAGNGNRKRFAIDLRSPEEIEADLTMDSEA